MNLFELDFDNLFRKYNLQFSDELLLKLIKVFTDKSPYLAISIVIENFKSRFYEIEPILLKDSYVAIKYAESFISERWPKLEKIIINDIQFSNVVKYSKIIGQRWSHGEKLLLKYKLHEFCFEYAKEIIRDRWPEAEPIILTNPSTSLKYVKQIIKGRWVEAEPLLLKNQKYRTKYRKFIKKTCGINLS